MKISVIIPMYNEEKIVADTVKELDAALLRDFGEGEYEMLFVSDGSSDKCLEIANSLKDEYKALRPLGYEKNQGKGYAVRYGMLKTEGDFVLFTDCDLAYGVDVIKEFYDEWVNSGKDIVIITDNTDENSNLARMIERFRAVLPYQTRVVNISEYPFSGGCLGCFRCAVSAKCVYKDGFDEFLRNNIQKADSIIYAFSIKDHSMGARFKMYDDRNFCNGHRTVTVGMPVGYLVSGELSVEENLRTIIEARAEVGHNFLAGVATDEKDTNAEIDALAKRLDYALKNKLVLSQNFYGIGGMKIFRDLIYKMQGMMRADHKFYKKGGYYNDFPQKDKKTIIMMYLVGALLANENIRKKMGNKMNDGMLMPYKKMFDEMDKKSK